MNHRSTVVDYFNKQNNALSGHLVFHGHSYGPRVIILGGTHGNEPAGVEAMYLISRFMQKGLLLEAGTLEFVIGNPEAYLKDVRYIDYDLNRAFNDTGKCFGHEEARAGQLRQFLTESGDYDLLIDLHSVSRGDEKIVIHRKDQTKTADFIHKLKLDYHELIYSQEYLTGLLIDIGYENGANAIAVECGNHNSSDAHLVGANIILKSIYQHGMIGHGDFEQFKKELDLSREVKKRFRFVIFDTVIPNSDDFKFLFKEDDTIIPLQQGQIYAESEGEIFKVEKDCFLMMPAKNIKKSDCDAGFFCLRHPIL